MNRGQVYFLYLDLWHLLVLNLLGKLIFSHLLARVRILAINFVFFLWFLGFLEFLYCIYNGLFIIFKRRIWRFTTWRDYCGRCYLKFWSWCGWYLVSDIGLRFLWGRRYFIGRRFSWRLRCISLILLWLLLSFVLRWLLINLSRRLWSLLSYILLILIILDCLRWLTLLLI
jgi:hypothetical protein